MDERDASPAAKRDIATLSNSIYRRRTRSARRMTLARRLLYAAAAPLLLGVVRLWWRSCRMVRVVGEEHLDAVLARAPSFLPCYWHHHQLFCADYLLRAQRRRPLRVGFLVSPSVDGELGAMIIRRAGAAVVRGSSSHTGALALKAYYEALVRERVSPAITPDGPRGPRFRFKSGAVLLSHLSGREMLPMAYCASRASLVHWDRFVLPWPLCRIAVAIGPPLAVPRGLGAPELESIAARMERALHETYRSAAIALGKSDA